MKLKVINATFGEAVKLQDNTLHNFVTSIKIHASRENVFELEYDTEAQLLMVGYGSSNVIAVGITNIKVMTLEQTSGIDSGIKAEGTIKKSKSA